MAGRIISVRYNISACLLHTAGGTRTGPRRPGQDNGSPSTRTTGERYLLCRYGCGQCLGSPHPRYLPICLPRYGWCCTSGVYYLVGSTRLADLLRAYMCSRYFSNNWYPTMEGLYDYEDWPGAVTGRGRWRCCAWWSRPVVSICRALKTGIVASSARPPPPTTCRPDFPNLGCIASRRDGHMAKVNLIAQESHSTPPLFLTSYPWHACPFEFPCHSPRSWRRIESTAWPPTFQRLFRCPDVGIWSSRSACRLRSPYR